MRMEHKGRSKITPNASGKELRIRVRDFCAENFDDFVRAWRSLDSERDKVSTYLSALRFVVPMLQNVSLESVSEKRDEIDKILEDMSNEMKEEKS